MTSSSRRPIAHRRKTPLRKRVTRGILIGVGVVVTSTLVAGGVFAVGLYNDITNGINRSSFTLPATVPSAKPNNEEMNILVMGLDSRVDQNGNALPEEVYQALRAGDETDGGYNSNVLMLVHLPAGDGRATGISIPRDDYVELVGAPGGVEKSKIKEAYGLAVYDRLSQESGPPSPEAYQEARAAGRQAQIATVSHFLGDVRIDHFIEVTMAAFYDIATAVDPIPVCLNHATEDKYSGAKFVAGPQDLSASQAMSFVRQRRDTGPSDLELTDFDRTRRQQAFIVSLAHKLSETNVLLDVKALRSLVNTAKTHIALDDDLSLFDLARRGSHLEGGNIDFVTLPIERFDTIDGKSVNIVNLDTVHTMVQELLSGGAQPPATDAPDAAPSAGGTTDGGTTESGANAPSTTTPDTSSPSEEQVSSDPGATSPADDHTYDSWETPLRSGAVPCVN